MEKIRDSFLRIIELILTPIAYVVVIVLTAVEMSARWLDRRFNTGLRKPKITLADIQRLIEVNSNSEAIFNFLKTHGFKYSGEVSEYNAQYEDNARFNHELPQQKELIRGLIPAWKRNVGRDLLVRWDIRIIFYLDDENKLVEYAVKSLGTGL